MSGGLDEEHIRNLRWLYDDEQSYQKAVRKLLNDKATEEQEKLEQKERRRQQLQRARGVVKTRTATIAKRYLGRVRITRRWALYGTFGFLGLVIIGAAGNAISLARTKKPPAAPAGTGAVHAPFKAAVTPKVAGDATQKYDPKKNVLSYPDKIGTTQIVISQQPLPAVFKTDPSKLLAFLDQNVPNRSSVAVPTGTAYMSVLEPDNTVQFSVYITDSALVFLRAQKPLPKQNWETYFAGLKTQ
jgi:hypothetical protein